jgi:hypothetical protein
MRVFFTDDCRNKSCKSAVPGQIWSPVSDRVNQYYVKFHCAKCSEQWTRRVGVVPFKETLPTPSDKEGEPILH